jgi:hypothetical protein
MPEGGELVPMAYLARRTSDLTTPEGWRRALENELPAAERADPGKSAAEKPHRTESILVMAWAAQQLGAQRAGDPETVALLERQVKERSLHYDWMYHGLEGAIAARALGDLGAKSAVPTLVQAFRRIDPALEKVRDPRYGPYPLAWTDFRLKMYLLPALGALPCPESKVLLREYIGLPEAAAREWGPLQYEEATRALLRQELSQSELEALLRSGNLAIRGPAVLECLDHPTRRRTRALKAAARWALELPRAAK